MRHLNGIAIQGEIESLHTCDVVWNVCVDEPRHSCLEVVAHCKLGDDGGIGTTSHRLCHRMHAPLLQEAQFASLWKSHANSTCISFKSSSLNCAARNAFSSTVNRESTAANFLDRNCKDRSLPRFVATNRPNMA